METLIYDQALRIKGRNDVAKCFPMRRFQSFCRIHADMRRNASFISQSFVEYKCMCKKGIRHDIEQTAQGWTGEKNRG